MRRGLNLTFAIAAKDWSLFWADRRAAVLCFLVPALLASGFGLVFARPQTGPAARLPLLIVCESDSMFARHVVSELLASSRVEGEVVSRAEAELRVAERHPSVAVVVSSRVAELAKSSPDSRVPVEILHHPLAGPEAQWAEGVLTETLMGCVIRARLGGAAAAFAPPFEAVLVPVAGEHAQFHPFAHSFSGMTLQYLLFWGMESGLSLLRDRRRSVWTRLTAAPVPIGAVLAGRAVATAAIAFLLVLSTFAVGNLIFGVEVSGSSVGFLLLAGAVSLLAAGTGLAVAAIGGTEPRARSGAVLVILGVSLLGGLWVPAFVLPSWAQNVAALFPTTWAMRGLDGVTWQGRGLLETLPSVGAVLGFAAIFLAVAAAALVSREARRRRGI